MRLLPNSNGSEASPAPPPAVAPSQDVGRIEALERIAKLILGRLADIEERMEALAKAPDAAAPTAAVPVPPVASRIVIDTDAIKKGVMDKMWKHLNDAQ